MGICLPLIMTEDKLDIQRTAIDGGEGDVNSARRSRPGTSAT